MTVVVLGAGYAGLTVALRLETGLPEDVDLVVVDESTDHLIRHELHRVIRRPGFADDITVPLSDLLDRATVRRARVNSVSPETNLVEMDGGELTYDYAAVCLGAQTHFYGLPGVDEHAIPIERIPDALHIRDQFLDLSSGGRTVIGGGGLTGIQVAGELAALAEEEGIDREIVLLEQLEDVAPGFPGNFRGAIREELDALDVEVRARTSIEGASADRIDLGETDLEYDVFIWAGGIRGPEAITGTRPRVRSTLRLDESTFVVGDAARVIDRDGESVPATAQAAIREARTAALNITRLVEYDRDGGTGFEPRLDTLDFEPRAWTVSVGNGAVAQVGPTVLRGAPALALKATAGVGYLTSVGAVREAVELAREEFSGVIRGGTGD